MIDLTGKSSMSPRPPVVVFKCHDVVEKRMMKVVGFLLRCPSLFYFSFPAVMAVMSDVSLFPVIALRLLSSQQCQLCLGDDDHHHHHTHHDHDVVSRCYLILHGPR